MKQLATKLTITGWIIAVWAVIFLGSALRVHNGDYYPINQNDDGLFYIWLGNSLWEDFRHPSSLTIFDTGNSHLFWRSQYRDMVPLERFGFRLSDMWFDHPFLAMPLMSLPARYFGFTGFSQIPHLLVRTPALLVAIATLWLTYLLAERMGGKETGFLALLFLACWPLAVFSQRQSYLENLLTPLLLLFLLVLWQCKDTVKWLAFTALAVIATFASWTKLSGFTLFGVGIYWLLNFNQKKWVWRMLIAAGLCIGLYLLYGQLVGGEHFWWTLRQQSDRGAYLSSIFHVLVTPQIYGIIEDGWWFLGLSALIYGLAQRKLPSLFISLSACFWFIGLFFLAGPSNNSPWYRYPVYPLMTVSLSMMIIEGYRRASVGVLFLVTLLGLTGWSLAGIAIPSTIIRMGVLGLISLIFLGMTLSQNKRRLINRTLLGLVLGVSLVGNILAIRYYPKIVCGEYNCVKPEKIIVPNL